MFKSIKAKARLVVLHNYGYVVLPSLLLMSVNAFVYLIINYFSTDIKWPFMSQWQQYLCFYTMLILKLIVLPISITMLYKVYIHATNNSLSVRNIFGLKGCGRAIIIDLIPNALSLIITISNNILTYFNIWHLQKPVVAVLSVVSIYISYKVFAAKYYIICNDASVKDAFLQSFNTMKGVFGDRLLLFISFFGWVFLQAFVYVAIMVCVYGANNITNIYTPNLDFLLRYGFGIGFYYTPYLYLTDMAFITDRISKKVPHNALVKTKK